MILIAHRGNLCGHSDKENASEYVDEAISLGFDVEIDIWYDNGQYWLGHDKPTYQVSFNWLTERNSSLWIHCKNIEALIQLRYSGLNYFWHEFDTVTLTSYGDIWAYPGKQPIKGSIAVLPELNDERVTECAGVCSDYIKQYQT